MEEYFKTDLSVLYKGDATQLDKLTSNSVDMVLTDPPYGVNYVTGHRTSASSVVHTNDRFTPIAGDEKFKSRLMRDSIWEMHRVMKVNTALYMFSRWDIVTRLQPLLEEVFEVRNIITWDKGNWTAGDLRGNYAFQTELIFYCVKGSHELRGKRDTNLLAFRRVDGAKLVHPAQKPVEILSYLISKSSDEGQVILDSFVGSGSTLVAATLMNRKSIGVDIDEENLKIAKSRLQQTTPLMFPQVEVQQSNF